MPSAWHIGGLGECFLKCENQRVSQDPGRTGSGPKGHLDNSAQLIGLCRLREKVWFVAGWEKGELEATQGQSSWHSLGKHVCAFTMCPVEPTGRRCFLLFCCSSGHGVVEEPWFTVESFKLSLWPGLAA